MGIVLAAAAIRLFQAEHRRIYPSFRKLFLIYLDERMFGWPWRKEKRVSGEEVDLVQETCLPFFGDHDHIPTYVYGIYLHGTRERIGYCD